MIRFPIVTCAAAVVAASCSAPPPPPVVFPVGELIDLTHVYDETTIFWPTSDMFRLEAVAEGVTPSGYYYAANNFSTAEHGGTHLDAPVHFSERGAAVDRIPLERFVGHAVIVDVTGDSAENADYQVTVDDLRRAERTLGEIAEGDIVLIRTGFSQRWPDAERYLGTAARGAAAVRDLHFPGLHPDAARWLIENRPIRAIGIDTASIDYGQSTLFESHRLLSERGIPIFENLAALEQLPLRGALVIALPMKIGGGSGAPLRAVALLPGP
jgi:kynurenine formamidase